MAPLTNTRLLFNKFPNGPVDPEDVFKVDKSQQFDIDTVELNGGIVIKTLSLSVDPYFIRLMNAPGSGNQNDSFSFRLGQPIFGYGVGVVLKSEDPSITPGEHLTGMFPFAEYTVLPDASKFVIVKQPGKEPWSIYVGVAGMPGQTAYHGYMEYIHGHAKKGDTLFVTTGAGAVGSLVIQLAKWQGLKVIASAGSEEKVKFMQECGADITFNYKTISYKKVLDKHGPINFYWDHVGGEALDAAFEAAAPFARFVNYRHILFKSLSIQGYIMTNLAEKYNKAFYEEIPPKVASGVIRYSEYRKHGLEATGQTLVDVLSGRNTGKAVIVVVED